MKSAFRRRYTADTRAVSAKNRSIFAATANVMLELGLLQRNMKANCLYPIRMTG